MRDDMRRGAASASSAADTAGAAGAADAEPVRDANGQSRAAVRIVWWVLHSVWGLP